MPINIELCFSLELYKVPGALKQNEDSCVRNVESNIMDWNHVFLFYCTFTSKIDPLKRNNTSRKAPQYLMPFITRCNMLSMRIHWQHPQGVDVDFFIHSENMSALHLHPDETWNTKFKNLKIENSLNQKSETLGSITSTPKNWKLFESKEWDLGFYNCKMPC